MSESKKTVLVVGDVVQCHHLAVEPGIHHPARTKVVREKGGAFYLKRLLERSVPEGTSVIGPEGAKVNAAEALSAYFQWEPFEEKPKIWRVRSASVEQSEDGAREQRHGDHANPDVLVIDDGNLGFRNHKAAWPLALAEGKPGSIILKTTRPIAQGALWEHLDKEGLLDRVTVVISAENIRSRGGSLSRALSWDAAVEDMICEMREDYSSRDLARCKRTLIYFGTAGVAWFERSEWQRLAYDPPHLEGTWEEMYPGKLVGAASTIAAAVTLYERAPDQSSLFTHLTRGLDGLREAHARGAGEYAKAFDVTLHSEIIARHLNPHGAEKEAGERPQKEIPKAKWASAFRPGYKQTLSPAWLEPSESDLLSAACGPDREYLAARAMDVVVRGLEKALPEVPRVSYGDYITVDREEIEGINGIRTLIQGYQRNPRDGRPLSIAVFGPPGSGKSFAIKQLSKTLQPKETPYEFNLSQFRDETDLVEAFHHVRDASVGNRIPIVFWDEFDSRELEWLRSFLAPMQDSQFYARGSVHRLGKAIFVFAGGTALNFLEFDRTNHSEVVVKKNFRDKKGNDFVSRLRGYMNIKGPNEVPDQDHAYLLRRATLLRSSIVRFHPQLIDPVDGRAHVSESVIRGFLRVADYTHGARSLETLVVMSREVSERSLTPADLPEKRVLDIHVSPDFLEHVSQAEIQFPAIGKFAEALHDAWFEARSEQGWQYGPKRDDANKLHPLMKRFSELTAAGRQEAKENNWLSATLLEAKLHRAGYRVVRKGDGAAASLGHDDIELLAMLEHDVWLRSHLLTGYDHGARTDGKLLLHSSIKAFSESTEADKDTNRAVARNLERILGEYGYQLRKLDPQ